MKCSSGNKGHRPKQTSSAGRPYNVGHLPGEAGLTLIEVLIATVLLMILIIGTVGALYFNTQASYRVADRTAAMTLVQAKLEAVRAATYHPPDSPFGPSTLSLTNNDSIALDKAGARFLIPGTLITRIEPVTSGHLVTVSGKFATPGRPLTVQLQTVVNKYSGGQRQK